MSWRGIPSRSRSSWNLQRDLKWHNNTHWPLHKSSPFKPKKEGERRSEGRKEKERRGNGQESKGEEMTKKRKEKERTGKKTNKAVVRERKQKEKNKERQRV